MSVVFTKKNDFKPQTPKAEICKKCNGNGHVQIDDHTVEMCICRIASMLRPRLGDEIALAPNIAESPFTEMLRANLMITSPWSEMLRHMKYAFIHEFVKTSFRFKFRVVTDEQLRAAFLAGGDRYENPEDTEEKMTDLISDDIDLVIIRLGFLGYKNQAMPGILLTALRSRQAAVKATWLVDTPDQRFMKGHLSWNEEVGAYVSSKYDSATIEADS